MKKEMIGKIFRIVSIVFISACIVFYGYRLIKYYKVFNPKTTSANEGLMSISIPKNSQIVIEGSGLYRLGGSYVYRGNVDNNYVKFSGMLFRINRINYGGTVELVTDDVINYLSYDKENVSFDKSNINEYLNNEFLSKLNKDFLVETEVCLDKVTDLSNITCENKKNTYVKLLDINAFLNSINEESYLAEDVMWLSNISETEVWHTNGVNISSSDSKNYYGIKPVITLKYDTILLNGKGTKDDPYVIEESEKPVIGQYVKINEDMWQIYETKDDKLNLVLNTTLDKTYSFSLTKNEFDINEANSLASYLNNIYLESLDYKQILLDNEMCVGTYDNDYKTICEKKVNAKVGLNSVTDILMKNDLNSYYLINGNSNKEVYTYGSEFGLSKFNLSKGIRPTISIKNTISKGKGTIDDPYIVEVK